MYEAASFCVLAVGLWLIIFRYTGRMESNIPLFIHACIVAHLKTFEDGLIPAIVYVGLVAGMCLRFEFMNKTFVRVIRTVETSAVAYVCWRCVNITMGNY